MRIAFIGTGEFGVPTLRALHAANHTIVRCVSQPDRPAGRGRQLQPTFVRAAAESLGLPHVQTADVNALPVADVLAGAELAFVVAFGQKIGAALLGGVPRGWVNLHASLLPRHRGAAPYQWAILSGDRETGVTIFQLDEKWDAGPIHGMRRTPIGELETADELHDRLARLGAELAVEVVAALEEGRATPQRQDAAAATRAPKLRKADAALDWQQPAFAVQRRIHGLWSWPGATCELAGERLQLARAALVDPDGSAAESIAAGWLLPDGRVQCGRGVIRLLEVKPAGGRLMPFEAFARGRRLAAAVPLRPAEMV